MKKRIISALGAFFLLSVLIIPVSAAVPDLSRTGSISAVMTHDGETVPGGTLTLYRVAELEVNGADYGYRYVEPYADCDISLDDIGSASTASALARYTVENRIVGETRRINADGRITFSDLQTGLYLLVQYIAPEGYYPMDPFLVSIPGLSEGTYIYDVNATPKLDLEPSTPTSEPTKPSIPTKPTGPSLPQTGQTNWPVPVMASAGMLMVALGWGLYASSKKKKYEA